MLSLLAEDNSPKGIRDYALIRVLADLGLRRGEVVGLDLEDLDLDQGIIAVRRKGHDGAKNLTLPPETLNALGAWVSRRGPRTGPLFTSLARWLVDQPTRLSGDGIGYVLKTRGIEAGVGAIRPHGLRHTAITTGLDASGGDLRRVQQFAAHTDPKVTTLYDDSRKDHAGEVARMVAARYGK